MLPGDLKATQGNPHTWLSVNNGSSDSLVRLTPGNLSPYKNLILRLKSRSIQGLQIKDSSIKGLFPSSAVYWRACQHESKVLTFRRHHVHVPKVEKSLQKGTSLMCSFSFPDFTGSREKPVNRARFHHLPNTWTQGFPPKGGDLMGSPGEKLYPQGTKNTLLLTYARVQICKYPGRQYSKENEHPK